jgi:GMP synthase-like glutamine amidotransferase
VKSRRVRSSCQKLAGNYIDHSIARTPIPEFDALVVMGNDNSRSLAGMCDQPQSISTIAALIRKCRHVYCQLAVDLSPTSYVQPLQFSGYGLVGSSRSVKLSLVKNAP